MNEFKVGDVVYCPSESNGVHRLGQFNGKPRGGVLLRLIHDNGSGVGKNIQKVFHATKENQALLESLYGVEFDDPPLSDREKVIRALQGADGKPVVCWVRSGNSDWHIRSIGGYVNNTFYSKDQTLRYIDVKPLSPDEFVLA